MALFVPSFAIAPVASLVSGIVLLCVGLVVFAFSFRYVWRVSSVYRASAASSPTAHSTGTLVRLSGTVSTTHDTNPLTAPFSGVDAVVLRYFIEEKRLGPTVPLPQFVTLHDATASRRFTLRTDTGTATVAEDPRTVALDARTIERVAPGETASDRIQRFERRADAVSRTSRWRDPPDSLRRVAGALSLGTRRYVEERVDVGDRVTVVGRVVAEAETTDSAHSRAVPPDSVGADDADPAEQVNDRDESGPTLEPIVVSGLSPGRTFRRLAKTSLAGLLVGSSTVLLGSALIVL